MYFVVSPKVFELQRCTIPHLKALDLLFWPLAWVITLGSIIFYREHKIPVAFFMHHPLVVKFWTIVWLTYYNYFWLIWCGHEDFLGTVTTPLENLGKTKPNFVSIPLKMGMATWKPPTWSGLDDFDHSAWPAGTSASDPVVRRNHSLYSMHKLVTRCRLMF